MAVSGRVVRGLALARVPTACASRLLSTSAGSAKEGEEYYSGQQRIVASPWKKFEQTVDRLSYTYLMEDSESPAQLASWVWTSSL